MHLMCTKDPCCRELFRFAVLCRGVTLLLQALFNLLVPDHAADAFSPPRLSEAGFCDQILEILLGGLSRWDAEHFLFIAEHGYVYEHNWAFFPLFPFSLRTVADTALWPLQGLLSLRSRLLLSAALLNTLFSVLASGVLYELSCVVLRCRRRAFLTALLFCLTPANVFMAAAYSESMFALLVFGALWQLEKGRCWISGLLFSAAASVRSNGLINCGFLLYSQTKHFVSQLQAEAGMGAKPHHITCRIITLGASLLVMSTSVFLPFALFQFCAYLRFCSPSGSPVVPGPLLQLAMHKGYHIAALEDKKPSWCSWNLPVIYTYIQDEYWNVGFLRYFMLKQIPNFFLAAPMIMLCSWATWWYIRANPWHCLTLGLVRRKTAGAEGDASGKPVAGFCSPDVFVYVVHAAALLMFGTFCMHVQVLTRLLSSSSPALYWFFAELLHDHEPLLQDSGLSMWDAAPHAEKTSLGDCRGGNPVLLLVCHWRETSTLTKIILGYVLSYWLLGLVLHCNFFPWT